MQRQACKLVGWLPCLEADDQWGGRQTQIDAYLRLYLQPYLYLGRQAYWSSACRS